MVASAWLPLPTMIPNASVAIAMLPQAYANIP